MDETIVVGVDGSPVSRIAPGWAVEEAELRGCAVEAVLAWHVDHGVVVGPVSAGIDLDEVREAHRRVPAELVAEAGPAVRAVLAEGDARDVLVKASEHAALLVVGSRGAGPVRAVLLGSVSSYCVQHASCPVVVVREPKPEHVDPKQVITPTPLL